MADYKYTVVDSQGRRTSGQHSADNRDAVADHLHQQGYTVLSIEEDLSANLQKLGSLQIGGVPLKERVIFSKQLAVMLGAGVPVVQALRILTDQMKSAFLQEKLEDVYAAVESGTKLSEAFAKQESFFNEVQISLIAAGERSGSLSEMLRKIAIDLEKSKKMRGRIRGALIYPAIIFVVVIVVVAVVMIFMIPSVKDLYADLGAGDLPGITQAMISISEFVTSPFGGLLSLFLLVGTGLGLRYYYSLPSGKRNMDRFFLRVPVFGSLSEKVHLTQFCRLLTMLTSSGVPIVDALRIVARAIPNKMYQETIEHAAQEVTKGTPLSLPLAWNGVFPDILLKIIATGEDTGQLETVLAEMGQYYEDEADEMSNNLTKLMEPIILLVVGVLVAFIAIAVYLPIYSLGQA